MPLHILNPSLNLHWREKEGQHCKWCSAMIVHNLRMIASILLFSPFLVFPSTDLLFWPLLSSELIVTPRAHSGGWKLLVPYVNIGLFSPCCFNYHKNTLFLSNFVRNLRCGSFCSKGWKSTVGENQRGLLKGTRTEFKMVLYSVISKGYCIIKPILYICLFSPLKTLNFCYASMTLNGAYGQLSIFCCMFVH